MHNLRLSEFHGRVWRHTATTQAPLDLRLNILRGGRFNPQLSFPMLYTALSVAGAKAEFVKSAFLINVKPESLLPRMLHEIEVGLAQVVDLTDKRNRRVLGCTVAELVDEDWTRTRQIGAQLQGLCDAILSYSAVNVRQKNLNLYLLHPHSATIISSHLIQTMRDWEHAAHKK